MRRFALLAAAGALLVAAIGQAALGAEVKVAVAANFTEPARAIAGVFKARTGHDAVLSFGSSGQFYAQITQDAPFEVFLSADAERPEKLAAEGLAASDSRFTYAIGKLVLWSRTDGLVKGEETLKAGAFAKIAIANPAAAPYGAAALETLDKLGVAEALAPKIVRGNSIAQTFQFVDTANAELGFIALSQLKTVTAGSRWIVPQALYKPIRQDAVLLKKGAGAEAAAAFIAFLKGPEATAIIRDYGYALDGDS